MVIGCGNIGALYDFDKDDILTHCKALHNNPNFSLTVYDTSKQRAEVVAGRYNCPICEAITTGVLGRFDCVCVSTPTDTHLSYLEKSLRAGLKLVICEKPVSNDAAELRAAKDLYLNNSSKVMVNYIRRFQPVYTELKTWINSFLEKETLTNISIRYQRGFLNNCSHAFNTVEFLFGAPMELNQVRIHNKVHDHFADDPTLSLQAFWNNANVTIVGLGNVKFSHFEIDLYFDYHKVCLKDSGNTIEVYKAKGSATFLQPLILQNAYTRSSCLKNSMTHVINYGYNLLTGKEESDNFLDSVELNKRMINYLNA